MKKLIALVLAALMLLSFAACAAEPAETEPADEETYFAIGTVIRTDGFMAIVDEDEFVLATEHDNIWDDSLSVGDVVVVTDTTIKKVASIGEAYEECFNVHQHIDNLYNENNGIIDYTVAMQYENCSEDEFAELLSKNECNYSTLNYIAKDMEGHAFDSLFGACAYLSRVGKVVLINGYFYTPDQL